MIAQPKLMAKQETEFKITQQYQCYVQGFH